MWSTDKHNEFYQNGEDVVVQIRPTAEETTEQVLYSDKKVCLKSFWNKAGKMVGYILKPTNKPLVHLSADDCGATNSFAVIYSKKKPVKVKLQILFDDHNIRLLGFKSGKNTTDYMLISRWREKQGKQYG